MALQFYELPIKEVIQETQDAISIVLEVPADLRDTFSYKPGQYLTVEVVIDDQKLRRAYSLSSSPHTDNQLKITTKRVGGGRVSNYLNDKAKPGAYLRVMPPMGNFTVTPDATNQRNCIFFSGGSGITPVISIMKSILKEEPHSKTWLFYGNRNAESIIFHKELKSLKEQYGDRLTLKHSLDTYSDDWQGYKGAIDKEKALHLLNTYCKNEKANADYFVCGPAGMMREVELALQYLFIDSKKIHKEHFTSNLEEKEEQPAGPHAPAEEGALTFPVRASVTLDGNEYEIEIGEQDTVLEAAIDADLDPPFACQIGACSTCRAKLHEGKVSMDEREALTDEEIEEGYILTCQSHPLTNTLKVDYDA